MVIIKRQKVKAYILLDSLVAFGILTMIATLVLGQMTYQRQERLQLLKKQEVLNVAQMAVQTSQSHLSLNGVKVDVRKTDQSIAVYHAGECVLYVSKN